MTVDEPILDDNGDPMISMEVGRVCCPAHGEVFRKEWPKGWLLFAVPLTAGVLQTEKFGTNVVGDTQEERVAAINATFAKRPACMWMPDDELRKLFKESGVLVPGICKLCSMPGPGGPYRFTELRGVVDLDHVCLNCIMRIGKRNHADLGGPPV